MKRATKGRKAQGAPEMVMIPRAKLAELAAMVQQIQAGLVKLRGHMERARVHCRPGQKARDRAALKAYEAGQAERRRIRRAERLAA